ncbi:MAG: electron transport complex subunit RsxC [Spirochaetes bacterium]|nr:electron transport complex subunit RsxC [Spirochaetota bacterium]
MSPTFRGGIHPPESKKVTEDCEFSNLSIPSKCFIPLQQHTGAPARPVVNIGDIVTEGQLIGASEGPVSANVHSSIPGKVVAIDTVPTVYHLQRAVVIEMEGSLSASASVRDKEDWRGMSREEIIQRIRDAGIVGLGGAAFPTAVKLVPPPDKKIDTLIINGAECEPYLTVDDVLVRTFPAEIVEGIQITLKALGIANAIVGIEDNKGRALRVLSGAVKGAAIEERIQVRGLKTKYPQGAEKQLIYSLLRRKVPSRGLPMDVGVVVQNVGTIYAIREAVAFKKPLFERYITVSGDLINRPGNYKIRLGMTVADIVEECGGLKGEPEKIIFGGPMCGVTVHTMDMPVVKGTSGILFLSKKQVSVEDFGPCIKCGRCVKACPVNLMPCDIASAVEVGRLDLAEGLSVFDCIMCGSCSYVCPSRRPLSHFVRLSQDRLRKKKK